MNRAEFEAGDSGGSARAGAPVALSVRALRCSYQSEVIIDNAWLDVRAGEVVAVTGPSGVGKSTFLLSIAGLLPIDSGHVWVAGRDVTELSPHERGCGLVFQDPLLFPNLNVVNNVAYGLRRHGATKAQATENALELLSWVGATELAYRQINTLSGGQAQRVALVRALGPRPAVLLLDEPFSALDSNVREAMAAQVRELVIRTGTAAVHVTHDDSEARAISDRVVTLQELFRPK